MRSFLCHQLCYQNQGNLDMLKCKLFIEVCYGLFDSVHRQWQYYQTKITETSWWLLCGE